MALNVTLLDLVSAVVEYADWDNEVIATVVYMVNRGVSVTDLTGSDSRPHMPKVLPGASAVSRRRSTFSGPSESLQEVRQILRFAQRATFGSEAAASGGQRATKAPRQTVGVNAE